MNDFHITSQCVTDLAQLVHNEIDENGVLNKEGIIECMLDQYADYLRKNIDWDEILDNDKETREFIRERTEAQKGDY